VDLGVDVLDFLAVLILDEDDLLADAVVAHELLGLLGAVLDAEHLDAQSGGHDEGVTLHVLHYVILAFAASATRAECHGAGGYDGRSQQNESCFFHFQ
jgi:hypothetical protein